MEDASHHKSGLSSNLKNKGGFFFSILCFFAMGRNFLKFEF